MVKSPSKVLFSIALLLAGAGATADVPSGISLSAECIKKEIYVGEQVMCNFVVAGPDDVLEVEVAKFPEFRGFWSENVALRQGPIPLMAGSDPTIRKAVIGSYVLTPMVGRADPHIVPMKVVVRRVTFAGAEKELILTSEPAPLKLNPLPAPSDEDKPLFKGAVGTFAFISETREVVFQKDEPVALRFSLQGEGNFQEINEIPLSLPPGVEVLSKRAYTQGAGQFYSKTFDVTLAVHNERDFELGAPPFVFFNPLLRRYEKLVLSPTPFRFVAATPRTRETDREALELPPPHETWTAYRPLWRNVAFWSLQALLALTGIGFALFRLREETERKRKSSRKFQRRLKWEIAVGALQMGNLETFLRLSDELVYEALKETFRLPDGLTRHQALLQLEGRLEPELLAAARTLFQARDNYSYSPEKTQPENLAALKSTLTKLLDESFRKRAA